MDSDKFATVDGGSMQEDGFDDIEMPEANIEHTGDYGNEADGYEQYIDLALADCANVHKIQVTLFVVQGWDGTQLTVSERREISMSQLTL